MTLVSTKRIVSYQGILSFPVIEDLLASAKQNLEEMELDMVTFKRLYAIMVESLENTLKHKLPVEEDKMHQPLEVELSLNNNVFVLKVGNYIKKSSSAILSNRIEEVNLLDRDGLNKLYRMSIAKARISDKGGAGLGIIDIARNSGQKINYKFINEGHDLCFFLIEISLLKPI